MAKWLEQSSVFESGIVRSSRVIQCAHFLATEKTQNTVEQLPSGPKINKKNVKGGVSPA